MKNIILAIALSLFIAPCVFAGGNELPTDGRGVKMQTFAPDPSKSQTNASMTGTIVFKVGTGGDVNITDWKFIQIDPTANSYYYFNSDTGKTWPLYTGVANGISLAQLPTGTTLNVVFGSATASVQGM